LSGSEIRGAAVKLTPDFVSLNPGYACSIRGLPVVTFSGISGSIDAGQ